MNYDDLIKKWHTKASEDDYFSKYVFEYLAFIATLRKKGFTEAHNDRHAIQLLKQDVHIKNLYLPQVAHSAAVTQAWQKIKDELDSIPLGNVSNAEQAEEILYWNCSYSELNQKTEKEKQRQSGILHNLEDWENMVEFWYSIRNNFFHGGKDPEDRRDQLLVKNSFITLQLLVKMMIYDDQVLISTYWEGN
jgi:hypothetical protein